MVKRVRIIKGGGERKETNPLKIVLLLIILAVLVYLLILTNKKTELTGNVITTLTIPSDCSNESLKALWDSIFKESSDSIIIYPNISQAGECTFQAYKIKNGQEVYSLFGGILAPNSKFISIQANYINFSDNYLNPLAINLTEITDLSKSLNWDQSVTDAYTNLENLAATESLELLTPAVLIALGNFYQSKNLMIFVVEGSKILASVVAELRAKTLFV